MDRWTKTHTEYCTYEHTQLNDNQINKESKRGGLGGGQNTLGGTENRGEGAAGGDRDPKLDTQQDRTR